MKIYIMRGCSGSGKSTFANSLNPDFIVSADHYFINDGIYKFDHTKLDMAHAQCLRQYVHIIRAYYTLPDNKILVVDNTNTTQNELVQYVNLANAYSHEYEIVTLTIGPEIAYSRNQHNVPLTTIKSQLNRIGQKLPSHWNQMHFNG